MSYTKRIAAGGLVWGAGDFLAQFYGAHKESAARRARGEKREGGRPTGKQMFDMLDKQRVLQGAVFGCAVGAAALQYQRVVLPRVFGTLRGSLTPCLFALGLQQMIVTPLILMTYFNAMTGARGGLSDPSFLSAHTVGAHPRFDVWAVQRHIFEETMPYPLLSSWAVAVPLYLLAYMGPFRGATFVAHSIALPWCASLSYIQASELL